MRRGEPSTTRRSLARQIDRLYVLPRETFLPARNSLAAALAGEGRAAEAAEVKRLRKPDRAAWVLNRIARESPGALGRFVEAVDTLKRAHFGEREQMETAREHEDAARDDVLKHAERLLAAEGIRPTAAVMRRIAETLLGAATDSTARPALEAGRLIGRMPAPGFDALLGADRRRRRRSGR